MKFKLIFLRLVALAVCFQNSNVVQAEQAVLEARDREVLQAFCVRFFADRLADPVTLRSGTNRNYLVFFSQNPEKTGDLMEGQMQADAGTNAIPAELIQEILRRNSAATPGHPYDAVQADYSKLILPTNIVVAARSPGRSFELYEKYPRSTGWIQPFLPAYSSKGDQALVRGIFGPSPYGSTVTCLLEKKEGKWIIKWIHESYYL